MVHVIQSLCHAECNKQYIFYTIIGQLFINLINTIIYSFMFGIVPTLPHTPYYFRIKAGINYI